MFRGYDYKNDPVVLETRLASVVHELGPSLHDRLLLASTGRGAWESSGPKEQREVEALSEAVAAFVEREKRETKAGALLLAQLKQADADGALDSLVIQAASESRFTRFFFYVLDGELSSAFPHYKGREEAAWRSLYRIQERCKEEWERGLTPVHALCSKLNRIRDPSDRWALIKEYLVPQPAGASSLPAPPRVSVRDWIDHVESYLRHFPGERAVK
jgi:hypothetical protein